MLPFYFWSGLRDSLGSLLRSPTRTRPTNSPPDCSLLRNGLFESLVLQPKNKKRRSTRLLLSLLWSGLRDSLGSLLRSPTRTRPTNSPPDCSLLRNGLFESLIPTTEKQKKEAMNASFLFLERITRLELATFTLAR